MTTGPLRAFELKRERDMWRRLALMFATLLIACVIVIVLQYLKLAP